MATVTRSWQCPTCLQDFTITLTHIIYACDCSDQRFHLHEVIKSDAEAVILTHRQECT